MMFVATHAAVLVALSLSATTTGEEFAPGEDFAGGRALAFGYASRATPIGNEAIFLNPAGLAISSRYSIDINYLHRFKSNVAYPSISVADSRTSKVAGGVAYSFERSIDGKLSSHHVYLSLAYPLGSWGAIGLTTKYLRGGGSIVKDFNAFTGDIGLFLKPFAGLCFGLVGYNLIDLKHDQYLPIMLGAGAGYLHDSFMVDFDFVVNLSLARKGITKFRYHVGGEYRIMNKFPVRVGYSKDDDTDTHRWSLGLGYYGESWGVDVGYRQNAHRPPDRELAATVKIML